MEDFELSGIIGVTLQSKSVCQMPVDTDNSDKYKSIKGTRKMNNVKCKTENMRLCQK